jgi:hypothetical protein
MRAIAILATVSVCSPALAETSAQAFECDLPYPAAMMAAGQLSVIKESSAPENYMGGAVSTVELTPGTTKVFGLAPSRMSLNLQQPREKATDRQVSIAFEAGFPRDKATDTALLGALGPLADCETGSDHCFGLPNALADHGRLEYWRYASELVLVCRYRIDEDEFGD